MTTTSLGESDMRSEARRLRGAARAWAAVTKARAIAQRAGAIDAYKMSYFATASLQERCTAAVFTSLMKAGCIASKSIDAS